MQGRSFLLMAAVVLAVTLAGCASDPQRIDRIASAAGLSRSVVTGATFRHVVYRNALAPSPRPLFVFLDGDGRPWSDDGLQPRSDPTTRNPLALKLLTRTSAPGIYISRPCYQQIADAACSSESWTGGRYSSAVIASIAAVTRDAAASGGFEKIVLVGYSGGGALAVLVAEQLENVAAVITIAANLDTDAWASYHHYLPLSASLNPAASNRAHPWREIHLTGARDAVVPATTTTAYFAKYPDAKQWPYADFDHVCCWAEQWPQVSARIVEELRK
jgi:pimeloyl-ACP methyl ester carboxylesterase